VCLCVCVCVRVCVRERQSYRRRYTYICIYIYVHMYICIYSCVYINIHVYMERSALSKTPHFRCIMPVLKLRLLLLWNSDKVCDWGLLASCNRNVLATLRVACVCTHVMWTCANVFLRLQKHTR